MLRVLVLLLLLLPGLLRPGTARAAEDYCAFGKASAVLLVDRTTAFDATDRTLFLQALDGIVAGLGPGDRLSAYTMTGAYTDSHKIFDRCKPACPETGFLAGLLATCRPVLARSAYLGFTRELAAALAGLLERPEETPYSDLFRTVAETLRAHAGRPARLRTLIVFSDLIENSQLLPERALKRLPPSEALKLLAGAGIRAELPGAEVKVIGFGRDDAPGRPPLPQAVRQRVEEIWRRWFAAGGAASVEIGFR